MPLQLNLNYHPNQGLNVHSLLFIPPRVFPIINYVSIIEPKKKNSIEPAFRLLWKALVFALLSPNSPWFIYCLTLSLLSLFPPFTFCL